MPKTKAPSAENGTTKVKRAPALTDPERLRLAKLFADGKDILLCSDGKAEVNKQKTKKWKEITDSMNARSTYKRSEEQLRRAWDNIGLHARPEIKKWKQAKTLTGGGPYTELSQLAKIYMDIYGEDNAIFCGFGGFQSGEDPRPLLEKIRATPVQEDDDMEQSDDDAEMNIINDDRFYRDEDDRDEHERPQPRLVSSASSHPSLSSSVISRRSLDSALLCRSGIHDNRMTRPVSTLTDINNYGIDNGDYDERPATSKDNTSTPANQKKKPKKLTAAERKDELMCSLMEQEIKKYEAETTYYELKVEKVRMEIERMRSQDI